MPGTVELDGDSFFLGQGAWWFPFHNAADGVAEMLIAGQEREYLDHMIRALMFDPARFTEYDLNVYYRSWSSPNGITAALGYYRTMPQDIAFAQDMIASDQLLDVPVLAVGGGHSTVGNSGTVASLERLSRSVQGVVIPPCGHYLAEECPVELLSVLNDFLARTSRSEE
ncbi:MAG: alpha/beta hydrolase [Pseudomonadota bacterium]